MRREGAVTSREAAAAEAVRTADARCAEAGAILAIVEGIAGGDLEFTDGQTGKVLVKAHGADPAKLADIAAYAKRSPSGRTKIMHALHGAWQRMKSRAESKAEVAAEAKFAREFEELHSVRDLLSRGMASFPGALREKVAGLLNGIVAPLVGVETRMRRRQRGWDDGDR